ncbi:MAG TPA: sigma-70 family RNA polymerase sigma factor [Phycisphaerae bacterium]|nr:sigma-70 family RNA polymerase sigma factor [Phycisphaerales bacterium]HRX85488.1 sigma-70 family RNA polymerase sigma factor [Phycisphaerae bacterium]
MMKSDPAETAAPQTRREEQELIRRVKRRDPAAMRQLIDLHKERLFAFVWRMVRNHHDAEEVCQDAFLKAFAALDTFDPTYRFSTWLFTIAYRVTLNVMRRRRGTATDIDLGLFADSGAGVEEQAVNSEEARRLKQSVWSAVDRLSPPQRAAVLLFYQQEQSCQDIAAVLDIPVATVKSHLHRARARLKEWLEPTWAEESNPGRIPRDLAG